MDDIAVGIGLGMFGIMLFYGVIDNMFIATVLGLGVGLGGFFFLSNWRA